MSTSYIAAQKEYNLLVEASYGNILVECPFNIWLERKKQAGQYWESAK